MEKIKLLTIDDEKSFTNMLSRVLRKMNFEVIAANSGIEALSIFEKDKFDLILLDLNMPVMNGLEILNEIKKIDAAIPVIFLSGSLHLNEKKLMEKGAVGFLRKPFQFDEMKLILNKIIEQNHLFKEYS